MALKDWKKDKFGNKISFQNKKTKEWINLFPSHPVVPIGLGNKYPDVWVFRTKDKREVFFDKKGKKAKAQALKYAKAYMKKH